MTGDALMVPQFFEVPVKGPDVGVAILKEYLLGMGATGEIGDGNGISQDTLVGPPATGGRGSGAGSGHRGPDLTGLSVCDPQPKVLAEEHLSAAIAIQVVHLIAVVRGSGLESGTGFAQLPQYLSLKVYSRKAGDGGIIVTSHIYPLGQYDLQATIAI